MDNPKQHFVFTCVVLLMLVFTSLLQPQQATARDLRAPGAFTKLTPVTLSAFQSPWSITLDWDDSAGASGYEYCFDKTDDEICDSSWISTGTDTSAVIVYLEALTRYYWQVRATDGGGYTYANDGTWWEFTTGAHARFHVETVENRVAGADWPPGDSVTVTVDDPANGIGVDFTATKTVDPYGSVFFPSPPGFQLGAGMVVTMNNGVIFKSHTVISLQVTSVDVDTDTVSGTGTVGVTVAAQHCEYNGCLWRRTTTVQSDGTWQVDFSKKGDLPQDQEILDIVPGTGGEALYYDEDADHTDASWYIYQRIDVHPQQDRVDGSGWIAGSMLTVAIDDPGSPANPDYSNTTSVIINPGDPNSTFFNLDFSGIYDLQPGHIVTVTDGTTTKTHTVTSVQILKVNATADMISGTATPDSFVDVETCGIGACYYRTEQADGSGNWLANFGVVGDQAWEQTVFDIRPDQTGIARQYDDDRDGTMIQWRAMHEVFLPLIMRN